MKEEFISLDDMLDFDLMDEEGEDLSLFDDEDEGFEVESFEDDLDDFSSFGF